MTKKISLFFILVCLSSFLFSQSVANKVSLKTIAKFDIERISRDGDCEFSSDGKYFFAFGGGKKLQIWETETQKLLYTLEGSFYFYRVKFSPDGKQIAGYSKGEILILNIETGKIQKIKVKEFRIFEWSPDSSKIAVSGYDYSVKVISAITGNIENSFNMWKKKRLFDKFSKSLAGGLFNKAQFSPDSKKLLTVSEDKDVELIDLATNQTIFTFENPKVNIQGLMEPPEIYEADFSPDGKWIITWSGETQIWDAQTGQPVISTVYSVKVPNFSPNSEYLGIVTDPNKTKSMVILKVNDNNKVAFSTLKDVGSVAAWSSDGKFFVTDHTRQENSENKAAIWNMQTGQQIIEFKTYSNRCFDFVSTCISDSDEFKFSPNDKYLMISNEKGIKFLNPENGEMIYQTDEFGSPAKWSPNNKYIIAKGTKNEKSKVFLLLLSE